MAVRKLTLNLYALQVNMDSASAWDLGVWRSVAELLGRRSPGKVGRASGNTAIRVSQGKYEHRYDDM